MNELKVPLAKDNQGLFYKPDDAQKGVEYFCPSCNAMLVFRKGDVNVTHFAHKASLTCTGETITHATAKGLIRQTILDWKSGKGECPKAVTQCRYCDKEIPFRLPQHIDYAILEYTLPEGFRGDVALMSNGQCIAIIEVKVTHKVDKRKHTELSVSYLELDGEQIIGNPLKWHIVSSRLKKDIESMCCSERCSVKLDGLIKWVRDKIDKIGGLDKETYDKKFNELLKKVRSKYNFPTFLFNTDSFYKEYAERLGSEEVERIRLERLKHLEFMKQLERERLERKEREREREEQLERERPERERLERERQQFEREKRERLERERPERERKQSERKEQFEREERERLERLSPRERKQYEWLERTKLEREQLERERLERLLELED